MGQTAIARDWSVQAHRIAVRRRRRGPLGSLAGAVRGSLGIGVAFVRWIHNVFLPQTRGDYSSLEVYQEVLRRKGRRETTRRTAMRAAARMPAKRARRLAEEVFRDHTTFGPASPGDTTPGEVHILPDDLTSSWHKFAPPHMAMSTRDERTVAGRNNGKAATGR